MAAVAAAAAAHMADVSWKMLELRARTKRSGLTARLCPRRAPRPLLAGSSPPH